MSTSIHPAVDNGIAKGAEGDQQGWNGPEFAAFVSSIIETGAPAAHMGEVRETLLSKGLQPYDCLNPTLMDLLASHAAKAKGTFREA